MKQQLIKATLATALGLGITTVAHAQINANDLVLGFTSPTAPSVGGTQFDYIINLGQLLGTSAHQITLTGSQYDNTTFVTDLGSSATSGGLNVGVIGTKAGSSGDVVMSSSGQPPTGTKNTYAAAASITVGLGAVAQGGNSFHQNISTAPGQPGANSANNWVLQIGASPLAGITAAQGTGASVVDLEVWEATYTSIPATASAFSDKGFVSILFNSDGGIGAVAWDQDAQLAAVPEPTYGLFGGLGVLLFALRRQFTRKTA
jgi:hypothetical protein